MRLSQWEKNSRSRFHCTDSSPLDAPIMVAMAVSFWELKVSVKGDKSPEDWIIIWGKDVFFPILS